MKKLFFLLSILFLCACGNSATSTPAQNNEMMLGTMRDRNFGFLLGRPQQVYLLNLDGSGESDRKPLWTSVNKSIWSPDGQWAAFDTRYSYDDEGSSIYIAKADGSQPQQVSYHEERDYHPSWSPDGTYIVYESNNTEDSQYLEDGIYTLDVNCIINETPCDLNPTYITQGSSPAWSPDGKQIVFQMECEEKYHYCLHVMRIDGIEPSIQLTPSRLSCYNPQWSPTGTEIVFTCYNQSCCSDEEAGIYKVKPDGTDFEMIFNNRKVGGPQWSPDGKKIAFIASYDVDLGKMIGWEAGYTSTVYIMNTDGTGLTRLSMRSDEDVYWFTWLPLSLQK